MTARLTVKVVALPRAHLGTWFKSLRHQIEHHRMSKKEEITTTTEMESGCFVTSQRMVVMNKCPGKRGGCGRLSWRVDLLGVSPWLFRNCEGVLCAEPAGTHAPTVECAYSP
ncbi:hypothetical protein CEXT_101981 [Caerostris extrusa]|uniref:Uncharacterized protein n=1 Tax=Caerostris extrusa TaxID=172846 RepID=A0AAV4V223_CAEEX|nr:hypothetical protein CEXT_101981 [Caerostris extrusa]